MWTSKLSQHCSQITVLSLCVLVILIGGAVETAAGVEAKSSPARKTKHPHCGLYCLYSAMRLGGKEIEFRDLVKPEYIGSRKGSSIAELKKAAEDNGLYAESLSRMSASVLKHSEYPIILHVKPGLEEKGYTHFELFLGSENGKAMLFDPPRSPQLVPFSELLPRWDGTGLVVSGKPIDLGHLLAPARWRLLVYCATGMVIIILCHWAKRRWFSKTLRAARVQLVGFSVLQGASLGLVMLLAAFIYNFADAGGLLAYPEAASSIQQAHMASFIPKVKTSRVGQLLNSDAVFIDARRARDFKANHLDGAINIPVDANDAELLQATAGMAKGTHIVVYCQSAGCKFAEKIAIRLINEGFFDVSVFKGGWHEWEAKNKEKKENAI